MEWELRIILGIIGAVIIGYVAFDGWRRSQKAKQARQEIKDLVNVDQDARDRQGFDYLGVSEPRTIKQSSANEQDSDNSASEIDNASVRPSVSNTNADQSSDKLSANKAEQIVITEDDAITADRHTMSSGGEEHLTAEPLVKSSDKSSSKHTDTVTHQEPELIFSLTLLSQETPFNGDALLQRLIEFGCRFGDMNIFHCCKTPGNDSEKYFSVANAFNPGVFDLDNMSQESFKGVSFFMGIPGAYEPEVAYKKMVETARALQKEFGGKLMDSSRSVFTEQTYQHEKEQINDYKRKSLTRS